MRSCSAEARLSGTRSKERFKKWWYSLLHFAWFFSLGGPCGRDERDGEVQCACRVSALPCVFKGVLLHFFHSTCIEIFSVKYLAELNVLLNAQEPPHS